MKRITNYLIALALTAFTLTSCEDVPSPFGDIVKPADDSAVVIEPSGTGTEADPFNVAGVIEYVSGLGADVVSPKDVYFKGYVTSITEAYGTQYGNATFEMSDTEDGGNKFLCYRVLYYDNSKYSDASAPNIKEGDLVVMCGKVVNYRGNTPETSANAAWLYSLNGTKGSGGGGGGDTPTPPPSGDAKGTGSQADPYNAAGANKYIATLAADAESPNDVYIKGKFVKYANNGEFNAQYGNASFYISDDGTESGEQFYVFRTLYLGNVKYTEGVTPKAGDDVVICGKVVNYKGNTPETSANKSYLYSLNGNTAGGGGGDTGGAKGTGTQNDPFNIAAAIAKCQEVGETASSESYYIKGIADAEYTVGSYKNVEIDIVDTEGSSDKFKVFRVKDKDGKGIKEGYKIPKGATIIVYGPVVNYKGNTPETATGAYLVSVNGKAPEVDGDSGSGGDSQGGGETSNTLTNGGFETWANGQPTGWKSASTASNATLEQSTDAHGGSYACIVKGGGTQNKRLASQEITLEAGSYTFAFYVKATSGNKAQVRPGFVPVTDGSVGNYTYGDYADINTSWSQVSTTFTLDAKTTVCLVVMNPKSGSYSSGEDVIVDDATLTKN